MVDKSSGEEGRRKSLVRGALLDSDISSNNIRIDLKALIVFVYEMSDLKDLRIFFPICK
jgi:hypothetical protein